MSALGATLGLGLVALPLIGGGGWSISTVFLSGILAVMASYPLARYVDYVDTMRPVFLVFTIGLFLYDIPAALGYLKTFGDLTLNMANVAGYVIAGVIAYCMIFLPDKVFHLIKSVAIIATLALLVVGGTPLKPGNTWVDIVGLTVFAYVGFSFPLRRARKYNEERRRFAEGVVLGFVVITALYLALLLLGFHGVIVYADRGGLVGLAVGILGLTAYVGFLKGIMSQLRVKYDAWRATVMVMLLNVIVPIAIVVTSLPIVKYLVYAGIVGGSIQYLVGLYLLIGKSFLNLYEKYVFSHNLNLRRWEL